MATIRVGDIDIRYELKGAGRPLVMIMGFSASMEWWPPQLVNKLAEQYQILLFDNRGAGRTDANKIALTIPLMAKDTVGLMDALGIQRAHIFGVSMGGLVAQEIALSYPDRAHQLVLGCTACGTRRGIKFSLERSKLWFDYLTDKNVRSRKLISNLLFSQIYLDQHQDELRHFGERIRNFTMPLKNQLKQFGAMIFFDTYSRLGKIKAPTLVMTGTEDYMVPHRNSDILAERIPDARLVKFEGCGHAFMAEAEEAVAQEMLGFLEA